MGVAHECTRHEQRPMRRPQGQAIDDFQWEGHDGDSAAASGALVSHPYTIEETRATRSIPLLAVFVSSSVRTASTYGLRLARNTMPASCAATEISPVLL